MNYLVLASIAYFVVALEIILDKFLLSSKRISHPAIYAFYSGIMTAFVLFLIPLPKFHLVGFGTTLGQLATGVIFVYGILSLFFAINRSEASRVMPVVGAMMPITTFVLSLLFFHDQLSNLQSVGVFVLIVGGLLISFDLPFKVSQKKFFKGFYLAILAGILLAIETAAFKGFTNHDNFLNVFIWTRIGVVLGALSLLFVPIWRKDILKSFSHSNRKEKDNHKTGFLFVVNKILGGVGSILTKNAIALGSVTVVNALVSIEYVFILVMGLIFSIKFPRIFQEKENLENIIQKVISIVIITIGIVLVSIK
jgi:uncharacterized membrane protein